ncbi:GHMP kinase [Spirochaetia bacterium 38H-sp]|uniref:GHMP kinase n=1 Tax=Rarispira pelagica TaxID=3141764 RepID=A0ABU9UAA7_9SPIR
MHAEAFCPGHITGLFYIPQQKENIQEKGSLGAGLSIDRGVTTCCSIEKGSGFEVYINDKEEESPTLSLDALMLFAREAGGLPDGKLVIRHTTELPIGCGLGTSGAAAISLLIALNRLAGSPLEELKLYQLAHKAEILAGTGLGTVLGQYTGGCKISIKPGAPGIGEALSIETTDISIIAAIYAPMLTSQALASEEVKKSINSAGKTLHRELVNNPTLENFIRTSTQFSEKANLFTDMLKPLHSDLAKNNIPHSMLMFGQGIYSICPEDETADLVKFYKVHCPEERLYIFKITEERGKLL